MLKKVLSKFDLADLFIVVVFSSIIFTVLFNYFSNGTYLKNIYHDFRTIEDHGRHVIGMTDKDNYPGFWLVFPPFAYLIYSFFLKSDTTIYNNMDYRLISNDTYHIYYFFVCVQLIIIAIILNELFKMFSLKKRLLIIFCIIFSYPLYYATVFQGNNILTVVILLLSSMSILNYGSVVFEISERSGKILSIIFISISSALKIVPAIFGIEYLRKKDFKTAFILIVVGILTFTLPFFYFDGFKTLFKYLEVLNGQVQEIPPTSIYYYMDYICKFILSQSIFDNIFLLRIFQLILLFFTLLMYFWANKNWERMLILCFACYSFIPRSFIYYLLYYLISLVFFIKEENQLFYEALITKKTNILYTVLFCFIFSMYIFHYTEGVHFFFSIVLIISLSIDIIIAKIKHND